MLCFLLVLLAFVCKLHVTIAAATEDEITNLPGWPTNVALPSKQYSGYLDIEDNTIHLHYWFVESELNPATAPTTIWFNGGPGCSSLDGFFYEQGPFELIESTESYAVHGVALKTREYRWNRIANMVFIEQPVGVGFSYGDSTVNINDNNDDNTALRNVQAVEAFFTKFPEYKGNEFYISGESYAGIYVPTLAEAILNATDHGTYTGATLTGIAVGNGCTGSETGICGYYDSDTCDGYYYETQFLANQAFFPPDLKVNISTFCDWSKCNNTVTVEQALSDECIAAVDAGAELLGWINVYNIYGECTVQTTCTEAGNWSGDDDNSVASSAHLRQMESGVGASVEGTLALVQEEKGYQKSKAGHIKHSYYRNNRKSRTPQRKLSTPHDDDDDYFVYPNFPVQYGPYGCIDSTLASNYLNDYKVQKAIHVEPISFCWGVCSDAPGFGYTETRTNLPKNTYPYLVERLKVVVYNGDWDACVPYTDNQAWTEGMGYPVEHPWKPWAFVAADNTTQVGGYEVVYDVSGVGAGTGSFKFMTVRGAGHMVPTDNPAAALEILSKLTGISDYGVGSTDDVYSNSNSNNDDDSDRKIMDRNIVIGIFVALTTVLACVIFYIMRRYKLEVKDSSDQAPLLFSTN